MEYVDCNDDVWSIARDSNLVYVAAGWTEDELLSEIGERFVLSGPYTRSIGGRDQMYAYVLGEEPSAQEAQDS